MIPLDLRWLSPPSRLKNLLCVLALFAIWTAPAQSREYQTAPYLYSEVNTLRTGCGGCTTTRTHNRVYGEAYMMPSSILQAEVLEVGGFPLLLVNGGFVQIGAVLEAPPSALSYGDSVAQLQFSILPGLVQPDGQLAFSDFEFTTTSGAFVARSELLEISGSLGVSVVWNETAAVEVIINDLPLMRAWASETAGLPYLNVGLNELGRGSFLLPIPEPGTALLMGLGLAGLAGRRKS